MRARAVALVPLVAAFLLGGPLATQTLVKDIRTGSATRTNTGASTMVFAGGRAWFTVELPDGHSRHAPRELWFTNGTAIGTNLAVDVHAGNKSGDPQWLVRASSSVYFTALDGATGYELHRIGVDTLGSYVAERFARGGTGSNGLVPGLRVTGVPRISNQTGFGLELFDARPGSIAALMISNAAARTQFGPGCSVLLALPAVQAQNVLAGPQGHANLSLRLPPNPALVGSEVLMQFWVIDPGACALGLVAPSDGLRIVFGS